MDLSAIKQRLDNLQSKAAPQQKTDYTTIFWRPSIGKQQVNSAIGIRFCFSIYRIEILLCDYK